MEDNDDEEANDNDDDDDDIGVHFSVTQLIGAPHRVAGTSRSEARWSPTYSTFDPTIVSLQLH